MGKYVWIGLLSLAVLAGCDSQNNDAKQKVKDILNDPDSAQFKGLEYHKDKNAVCGWVNAKNRFGAYVGFTPFVSQSGGATIIQEQPSNLDFDSYFEFSNGNDDGQYQEMTQKCWNIYLWQSQCGSVIQRPNGYCALVLQGKNEMDLYNHYRDRNKSSQF